MKQGNMKVILADNNVQDRESREKAMESAGMQVVYSTGDGKRALDAIEREEPDIVVLDMILPGLDGMGILEEMDQMDLSFRPMVVIVTALKMSHLVEEALKHGADYYMMKPISNRIFVKRLVQMSEGTEKENIRKPMLRERGLSRSGENSNLAATDEVRSKHRNLTDRILLEASLQDKNQQAEKTKSDKAVLKLSGDLELDVTRVLLEIGIPAHIKGYQYIREGILLSVEDRSMLQYITKYLYPSIAKKYRTTSSSVERTIRHAIEVAWQRGDSEVLRRVFGNTICAGKGKPTNSEFMALLTDKFRLEYRLDGSQA